MCIFPVMSIFLIGCFLFRPAVQPRSSRTQRSDAGNHYKKPPIQRRRTQALVVRLADVGKCDQCERLILWKNLPRHYAQQHGAIFAELWAHRSARELIDHVARRQTEQRRESSAAAESVAETDVTSAEGSTGGGALSGGDIANHGGNTNDCGSNHGGNANCRGSVHGGNIDDGGKNDGGSTNGDGSNHGGATNDDSRDTEETTNGGTDHGGTFAGDGDTSDACRSLETDGRLNSPWLIPCR